MKQREIKFRAWDIEKKEWIEDSGTTFTSEKASNGQVGLSLDGHLRVFCANHYDPQEDADGNKISDYESYVSNSEYESVHPMETDPHYKQQYILMQFTGLKDKNGKEIYEGDIVRILYTDWGSKEYGTLEQKAMELEDYKKSISQIGSVVWARDRWELKFGKNRFGEFTWGSLQEGNHGEKEIIGNIYENPELLTP